MIRKILSLFALILSLASLYPVEARADLNDKEYKVKASEILTQTKQYLKVQKDGLLAREDMSEDSDLIKTIAKGSNLEIKEIINKDWIKIDIDSKEAYINFDPSKAVIYEVLKSSVDTETQSRQDIVDFALSFEGGKYVWGGINPHVGVDCSGFTRYVIYNILGKNLPHSSKAQANCGRKISKDMLRPGDLVFYASGSINHVAIYIGNSKVISASTESKGIVISPYNYRQPVKYVSMF